MALQHWRALRLCVGLVGVVAPGAVLRVIDRSAPPRAGAVVRVLGARHVVQAVVTTDPGRARLGAVVDAAHVATLLATALFSPRWRRAALADCVVAVTIGVGTLRAAHHRH
jgi:hypothetical protein